MLREAFGRIDADNATDAAMGRTAAGGILVAEALRDLRIVARALTTTTSG